MKKILAMVCAVMILISAMPITAFADGNSFDYSIGAEVVSDSQPAGSIPEGSYWQERTVDKELSCTEEHSHEDNCYSAITPYKIWTLCGSAPAEPEQTPEPVLKANEEQITKSLTVSMGFAADSDIQKAACTASASVQVKDQTNTVVATLVLSPDNDFTASCELPEATTAIFVTPSGGEMAGYSNQFAFSNANHVYYVPESGQINAALTVKYYNPCTVSVNFTFHPESELGAEDFPGGFDVQVRSATTLAPADTLHISPENNWSATSKPIVPGKYFLQYQNTSKEGYYMEPINVSVFTVASNENAVRNISGRYSSKGTLNVVSSFDENSALDGEDLIALGINKLAFEILDSENNVVATDEIDDRDWSVAVGDFFPGTYSVRFTDSVPGYNLSVSNTSATVVTGETVAIKPSLCFTEEEQIATAKISIDFAETSDLNRDNFPGDFVFTVSGDDMDTVSTVLNAANGWVSEFTVPTGAMRFDIESDVLEDYYLDSTGYEYINSGCELWGSEGDYANLDEFYFHFYHDIIMKADGSYILNLTLDIREKEKPAGTGLVGISVDFADTSVLTRDNFPGDFTFSVSGDDMETLETVLNTENGWEAEFTVPTGAMRFDIESDVLEDYYLDSTGYEYINSGCELWGSEGDYANLHEFYFHFYHDIIMKADGSYILNLTLDIREKEKPAETATAKISIDFAETSDLNRENYPGYISVSIGSEENGTEAYAFGADTVWEAEFEFPAGLVTLDIESELLEDYYLEDASEDMTDSGCEFFAGGASYWNPDEYYYYKYHDIEFAPDGSLILNITLDIREKESEVDPDDPIAPTETATAKISIDFAETSDLNRDNYPGYISVSIGSEENGTEGYAFGADTVWEAEFEFPAGLVTLDIESEVLEDYYLENANEDMTDSGCDFQAGGASYWNPDEYYYYKYHDIEFAPDGSLILNITLDIRAKEVEKETSLLIVSLNELALLHEGGTTTETSVGNTGYESESYTVTVTPKDGEAQSKQITADTLCNFNVFVGDELTITLSNGYYTYEFSEDELIVDSALERVTVDVTYHYAPRSPFAVDCLNVDKNTGAALGGGEFYLAPPPDSALAAIGCVANDNGEFGFIISEPGTYTIGQSKAPQGYQLNNSTITLTVETMWTVAVYSDNIPIITDTFTYNHSCETDDNGNLLFKNTNETVELTVVKRFVFDKKEDRPESIVVALYKDGIECDRVTLSEANNWTYKWKDLPGGHEYTVDEPVVPAGYVKYFIVEGSTVTIVNSGNIIPATGDQDINLWLSLAVMSLFGCTSLIIRRRKNEAAE